MKLFLLEHLVKREEGAENLKTVGVFASEELALQAIERLKLMPGFRENPNVVDFDRSENEEGFYLSSITLNKTMWAEGFVGEKGDSQIY